MNTEETEIKEDLERIQKVLLNNFNEVSLQECKRLWRAYSSSLNSEWVSLNPYEDHEIFESVKIFFRGR
jgi:hypothetical protein